MLGVAATTPKTALEQQLFLEVNWLEGEVARRDEVIAQQQRRIAELELAVARAKKNSRTSSKPPSSDIVKPGNNRGEKGGENGGEKRKIGGQPGHPRHERTPFEGAEITQTHVHGLCACPGCQSKDLVLLPERMRAVQQVEVEATLPWRVDEHQSLAYLCLGCGNVHYAPLPPAVEKGGLIGPILTAQIAYMKGVMHASFSTIRKYVRDVMGLTISRGQLSKIIGKVTDAMADPYADLLALLKSEPVLNVDETGHKDNGDRFWTWCFRGKEHCVFAVMDTRSTQVLLDILGKEFEGALGCDHYTVYRKYLRDCDVRVQFCLAHFIRDIRFLTTLPDPAAVDYGNRLLERIRTLFFAIHSEDLYAPDRFTQALESLRAEIVQEAQRDVPENHEAQLIAQRLRDYENEYFQFIYVPGLEPTNNPAEQMIRFVTIDRHITQGTRSEQGRHWCERIWTVLATCSMQGRSAYDYLVQVVQAHFNGEPIPRLAPHPT